MEVSGGSKKFTDIRGAGWRNMLAGIAFVVGSLSMIGIPFTAGFVSKMNLAAAALEMPGKMIPALIVLSCVIAIPILRGIWTSFCDCSLRNLMSPTWAGLKNYIALFKKGEFFTYFFHTLVFVFFTVSIQLILGMGVALLLTSKIRGRAVFRGMMLIPWTIPSVVVALVWRWILQQQYGVINYLLMKVGIIDGMNLSWTMDATLAMICRAEPSSAICMRQLPPIPIRATGIIMTGFQVYLYSTQML